MRFTNLLRKLAGVVLPLSLTACVTLFDAPEDQVSAPVPASAKPATVETPPMSPESRVAYERALAALKAGRFTEAERELATLALREPRFAGPHANLGILYHRTGRAVQAVEALDRAIRLNPERAAYHNELGLVHRNEGRFAEARQAYVRAIELDPNYAYAHLNLGILYDIYLQDGEKAMPHYERYKALVPAESATVAKWIADLKQRARTADQTKGGKNG